MAKWQRVRIEVPEKYGRRDRERIGEEVVEFIRDRTESGKNKNNRNFPRYSESYIKSLDFKIAGKSPSKVNLTLTGDMLIEMDLISEKPGSILIGMERGSENNDKADGHITGNVGKRRDFLGITKKDLLSVIARLEDEGAIGS